MKKMGRNDPCYCGSGKKYKQCCLSSEVASTNNDDAHVKSLADAIEIALEHHRADRLSLAESIYQQVLHIEPKHPVALHFLGVIANQAGKSELAIELIAKALAIKPDYFMAHNNLGNALKEAGRLDEAVLSYLTALRYKPDYAEAHNNLGNAFSEQGKFEQALACYQQAIKFNPDHFFAYSNQGAILKKQGKLDEAIVCYRTAIKLKPDHADAYNNFANALRAQGRLDDAVINYRKAIKFKANFPMALYNLAVAQKEQGKLDEAFSSYHHVLSIDPQGNSGLESAEKLSVLCYLRNDLQSVGKFIELAAPLKERRAKHLLPSQGYLNFMVDLLNWWTQPNRVFGRMDEFANLYVVGDSHCLSVHNQIVNYHGERLQCKALWIEGCKQWNLGRACDNQYKYAFDVMLRSIPLNSTLLLTIGEIDCRFNEGIFKVWGKNPEQKLGDIVATTIASYLEYIAKVSSEHGYRIIVCGVPATNAMLQDLAPEMTGHYIWMIGEFNAILRKESSERGMGFLDVYSMTNAGNGVANQYWHLDDCHLRPDAYVEAFNHYYFDAGI